MFLHDSLRTLPTEMRKSFDSMEQYREYVQQNVKTINRFDIILDALKRLGGLQSTWVKPNESLERAASRLQGALVIEAVPDTYQITITLDGKRKAGLAELVNSVADTYLEKAKAEEFFGSNQRVQSLLDDRARLQKEIADKQARRMTPGPAAGRQQLYRQRSQPLRPVAGHCEGSAVGSAESRYTGGDPTRCLRR